MQRELLRNHRTLGGAEVKVHVLFIDYYLAFCFNSHWMVDLHDSCYCASTAIVSSQSICYMRHLFMLHLECHLLQDSLCVFPWTSSKISDGFIFLSYPLHRFCIPLLILSISTKRSGNCISMSFFQDWQKKEVMVTMDPVLFVTRHACRYSLCSCQILLLAADIYIESSYSTLQLIFMSNSPACVKRLVFMSTAEDKQITLGPHLLVFLSILYCENSFLTLL